MAIATLRNKIGDGESNFFGGIFFVRADNSEINQVSDIKGKVIAASSILSMGSGQTQWQEMRKYGIDLLVDAAQARHLPSFPRSVFNRGSLSQVIFVGDDQTKVVNEILGGRADVG
jgi:hypothetical protein